MTSPGRVRTLYAATVAVAAGLGFVVQPLVAKALLPGLGGTPAVWNTVAVFFQAALLGGYALAHEMNRRLPPRGAVAAHLGLLVAGALVLPLGVSGGEAGVSSGPVAVALEVTRALGVALLLPALAIGATAPALQRWLSRIPDAGDPYPLYAASNIGSIVGLLAYPVLIERVLDSDAQGLAWTIGYGALIVLTVGSALGTRQAPAHRREDAPMVPGRRRLWWLVCAALPAANVLAVTTHVTTDLAPVPMLWVLPLAVYLLTYALAFSRWGLIARDLAVRVMPIAGIAVAPLLLLGISAPTLVIIGAHLAWLALSATVFHGELARTRPPPAGLTRFYLWLAIGGVIGGATISFLAPAISSRNVDLPVLTAAMLLALPAARPTARPRLIVAAVVVVLASAAVLLVGTGQEHGTTRVPSAPFVILLVPFILGLRRPRIAAATAAVVLLAGTTLLELRSPVVVASRSFFAAYRVVEDPDRDLRWLAHGRTIHGAVSGDPGVAGECLPYHHRNSPVAGAFALAGARGPAPRILVVGLGIGCMAALRPSGGYLRFVEIDSEVVRLAREYFPFLDRCGDACDVVVGDGRVALRDDPDRYDLIVLDAFASDAVPIHLLTAEALGVYLDRLAPGGLLAFHVTNHHVDLTGVLTAAGRVHGLTGRLGVYDPAADHDSDPRDVERYLAATRWVVLAREPDGLAGLPPAPGLTWSPPDAAGTRRPWTDRHADLWSAIIPGEPGP